MDIMDVQQFHWREVLRSRLQLPSTLHPWLFTHTSSGARLEGILLYPVQLNQIQWHPSRGGDHFTGVSLGS